MFDPSDLGRRLRERRDVLGLSAEEVADRAHIDAGYLEYLETDPGPDPSAAAVVRLAAALGTTSAYLRGSGQGAPPGGTPARPEADLIKLTPAECRTLIRPGGIGRFVYVEPRGPVAVPVNFRMLDDEPVFRTAEDTLAVRHAVDRRGSLEVDQLDAALSEGWSVLVSGTVHRLSRAEDIELVSHTGVEPWPGGYRHTWLRIRPELISGRRIRHPTRDFRPGRGDFLPGDSRPLPPDHGPITEKQEKVS